MLRYAISLLLLWSGLATGQATAVPLALETTGRITYQPTSGSPFTVYSGTYLNREGTLLIADSSRLDLLHGDRIVRLTGPMKTTLTEALHNKPAAKGWLRRFVDFIYQGIDQSRYRESLEQAYLRNQGNAQGNISGYGDRGLGRISPFGGTLAAESVTFTWPETDAADSYLFRIRDSLSGTTLVSETLRDTAITLDLASLDLRPDRRYLWEVRLPGDADALLPADRSEAGPVVQIAFAVSRMTSREVLDSLLSTEDYQELRFSPVVGLLVEAMVLEEAGYLHAADQRYREGMAAGEDNTIIRRHYAAFLARWNLRSVAQELITEQP